MATGAITRSKARSNNVDNDYINRRNLIVAANSHENPLDLLSPLFRKYANNGVNLAIEFFKRADVAKADLDWCLQLLETNMKTFYENSKGGWHPRQKRREMLDEEALYLLVRSVDAGKNAQDSGTDSAGGELVGFVHFRFDLDYELPVLYCYEIQLAPAARQKSVGKFLMQLLQALACETQMAKVVLTVFKQNVVGLQFFRRLGFADDSTSPGEVECCDYVILSRPVFIGV